MTEIKFISEITVEPIRVFAEDAWIEEAARISTLSESTGKTTGGLIRRLMRDRHGTPFEHGGTFTLRVHAPIFVFREWQRHRVGWSYNEQSGRYTEFEPVFYVPAPDRPLVQTGKPMDYSFDQGSDQQHRYVEIATRQPCRHAWDSYTAMLDSGIAREVARSVLPVTIYSSMYATCNPRSLMHFLGLRTKAAPGTALFPSNPQWEINQAADQVEEIFRTAMPLTHAAWDNNGRVAP